MKKVFSYIDTNREKFINNLAEAVEIKSVSAWPETREVRTYELAMVYDRYSIYGYRLNIDVHESVYGTVCCPRNVKEFAKSHLCCQIGVARYFNNRF